MKPILGVLADDLTGGMEVAAMLVKHGVRCAFLTDPTLVGHHEDVDAIVVARKIRTVAASDAVAEAENAGTRLLKAGVRQIFYKYCATFDSTDEGNIGPVADRLAALTGASCTLFCPSFPEAARTVYNGHLFVADQLVSASPKRFDPLTPMTDPNLVGVLQRQTAHDVGLLAHRFLTQGQDALERHVESLKAGGKEYLIADAIDADDLKVLAELATEWSLLTGNSSVAEYLPANWEKRGWFEPGPVVEPAKVSGPAVVLAGSCADQTLRQLDAFEETRPVLRIDLRGEESIDAHVENAFRWAREQLDGGPVAIATCAPPDVIADIQQKLGRREASLAAETILGRLAVKLRDHGVRRFLVAGGETSGVVVNALGIGRLHVGSYREPGIAVASTVEGEKLALCLKSGKLGPIDMFHNVLDMMSSETE